MIVSSTTPVFNIDCVREYYITDLIAENLYILHQIRTFDVLKKLN